MIEAMIWIAILMLLISRKIYRVVRNLNPEAKMARFTTLRWSNIFTENASSVLAGVLRYMGLETSLITSFEIGLSEAVDPHMNRRRFTEEWWA